jgi:hypothetical protein
MLPLIITVLCCSPVLWIYNKIVLPYAEQRKDLVVLSDLLVDRLPTIDASLPVSIISTFVTVLFVWNMDMYKGIFFIWAFASCIIMRSIFLLLCPFKSHPKQIILRDYVTDTISGYDTPLVNDLFFSGHVSTLMIVIQTIPEQAWILNPTIIILSFLLLLCKTHYTIDVLVVPFIVPVTSSFARQCTDYVFELF